VTLAPTDPRRAPVVVVPAAADVPERRRSTSSLRREDVLALLGAALGSASLTALLFTLLAPFDGALGAVVVAWVLFVALYAVLVGFDEDGPTVRDRVAAVVVQSVAALVLLALVSVLSYTAYRGRSALAHLNFFTSDVSATGPLDPLSSGGILHAAVGTLEQITLALVLVVPLGLATAVFLTEVPGPFSRFVRTISEAMTALPSIVCGLFVYATFILALGQGKSGSAAALALSVMMLPIVVRAADVVLRLVPGSLKEASLALGTGQWRTVWHVTLPTARSGLATAVILGAARGIGETSPVLLTAGSTASLNGNPFSGPQVSLPLAVFEFVKSPQPTQIARGFGSAVALLALVLVLFLLARVVGGRAPGDLSRRAVRARAAASARDLARAEARTRGPDPHVSA
jgi:phosphate transport system permease protein